MPAGVRAGRPSCSRPHRKERRKGSGSREGGRWSPETEREGFEPSTEVTSCNSLAGSRFQPLSHLSSGFKSLSAPRRPLQRSPGSAKAPPRLECTIGSGPSPESRSTMGSPGHARPRHLDSAPRSPRRRTLDGTAFLRIILHSDGNTQYANYQNFAQMSSTLTGLGQGSLIPDIIA